jgi:hypothetical protein
MGSHISKEDIDETMSSFINLNNDNTTQIEKIEMRVILLEEKIEYLEKYIKTLSNEHI